MKYISKISLNYLIFNWISTNRVMVEKKIPKCGHKVKAECGKKLSKNDCISMCEKTLDCGHPCPLPCREPCTTNSCQQEVELESAYLPCGHSLKGKCCLRYAGNSSRYFAKAISFYFILKSFQTRILFKPKWWRLNNVLHLVNIDCFVIIAVPQNVMNVKPTDFTPFVSNVATKFWSAATSTWFYWQMNWFKLKKGFSLTCYRCEDKCAKVCPPCKKPCNYRCFHQKCTQSCGDDCTICVVTFWNNYPLIIKKEKIEINYY